MAVNEILLETPGLPNLIREGNIPMLQTVLQSGKSIGMQILDDVLLDLLQEGTITAKDAFLKANDKSKFEALLQKEETE